MATQRSMLTACLTLLIASTGIWAAEVAPAKPQTDVVAGIPTTMLSAPATSAPRATPSVTIDRSLWNDPKIHSPDLLVENGWDFTDPNGVPGFGPLPPAASR